MLLSVTVWRKLQCTVWRKLHQDVKDKMQTILNVVDDRSKAEKTSLLPGGGMSVIATLEEEMAATIEEEANLNPAASAALRPSPFDGRRLTPRSPTETAFCRGQGCTRRCEATEANGQPALIRPCQATCPHWTCAAHGRWLPTSITCSCCILDEEIRRREQRMRPVAASETTSSGPSGTHTGSGATGSGSGQAGSLSSESDQDDQPRRGVRLWPIV